MENTSQLDTLPLSPDFAETESHLPNLELSASALLTGKEAVVVHALDYIMAGRPFAWDIGPLGFASQAISPEQNDNMDHLKSIDCRTKSEHRQGTMTVLTPHLGLILELIDQNHLDTRVASLLKKEDILEHLFDSTALWRIPVKKGATINGYPIHDGISSVGPDGCRWMQFMYIGPRQGANHELLKYLYQGDKHHPTGIGILAATSANATKEASYTRYQQVRDFMERSPELNLFVTADFRNHPDMPLDWTGSCSVLTVGKPGAKVPNKEHHFELSQPVMLVRQGNLPPHFYQMVLEEFDIELGILAGVEASTQQMPDVRHVEHALSLFALFYPHKFPQPQE